MLNDYMNKAMQHAEFKSLADGTIFGSIPGFRGVWANADTVEACQEELRDVLEGWLLLGIANHATLPEVDGVKLEIGKIVNA